MSKSYLENYFRTNEIIFYLAGIWMYNKEKVSAYRKMLQTIYSVVLYTFMLVFLVLEFIMFKDTIKNTRMFIAHFEMLLSTVLAFVKMISLCVRHDKLQNMMDALQDDDYAYEPTDKFDPKRIFIEARKNTKSVSLKLLALYSTVGIFAHLSSEMSLYQVKQSKDIDCNGYLMYYFYIPFRSDTKRTCQGANFFMGFCLLGHAIVIASHDTLYAALLNCLRTQFVILCNAIKTIRARVVKRLSLPANLEVFNDEHFPVLESEMYKELKKVTRHLIILLGIAEEMEGIFNFILLGQVTNSLISFAAVLFVVTNEPLASPKFFSQLAFFACLLTQFGTFCWYCDKIRNSCQDILYALYECDWLSSSRRFKSSLITTMSRMQRPIYLSFGKFCPLTLNSLVSVCKCSFSYYMVFRTANE